MWSGCYDQEREAGKGEVGVRATQQDPSAGLL